MSKRMSLMTDSPVGSMVGGDSNLVNAVLTNCEDVQMGQRFVNKIDLNIFCPQDDKNVKCSPEVSAGENKVQVSLQPRSARSSIHLLKKACGCRLFGRTDYCFLILICVFFTCLGFFLGLLVNYSRRSSSDAGCEDNAECGDGKLCVTGSCGDPCLGACDPNSFCEFNGHVPFCFQPGKLQKLITNPDAYATNNYTFFPAPQKFDTRVIRFKVKASYDANVFISQEANPTNQPYYWIIIGGNSNKWSAISQNRFLEDYFQTKQDTPDILNPQQFRGFWVSVANGSVSVGRESELTPFLTWTDPKPLKFKFFGVSTYNCKGEWIIYGAGCVEHDDCGEGMACFSGACGDPCLNACDPDASCDVISHRPSCFQPANTTKLTTNVHALISFVYTFYSAPANGVIRFRVKTTNDANVLLSGSGDSRIHPYYEIVIGELSNTKSGIRTDRRTMSTHKVQEETLGIVSPSQFRGFWISFRFGTIRVGKESEDTPFMSWTDPEPFQVKYFGLSTFGSSGDWIIYNT